ncbi:hypothetical protein HPB49_002271 [Dermacentor silvarum]|uniref:Uncharacterized protein n=1 Tax=Dermacentor silvarum TaxID=543639 RepID=A0ACB8C1V6_DERSI|nr:hypothetical protein HPB49_002271 [Dermacentor silvarum]
MQHRLRETDAALLVNCHLVSRNLPCSYPKVSGGHSPSLATISPSKRDLLDRGPTRRTGRTTPGASPSSANHRQPTMMEVQVEGITLREEHYDPADWTKIIRTYQGKSQSKARMEDTNGVRGKQKASEERTETLPASTWRPTYRPNPANLRATQQVKRKSRQMALLPQHAIKVVFRSQGGLFLPNIQPQLLLRGLCETAKIPMGAEVQLRVHPMNNTCTVTTTNQDASLNLVKIRSISLNAKAYGVAAYIVPAADTVRGVISNAFWDETEEELLQDLKARNPEAGILLARRMGKSKSILITFAQEPIPRTIIYYGGVYLCTPYRARPEACTNCRAPGHRYDVCPEPKIPRCPRCGDDHGENRTRQCVPRCILCGGEHLTGTGWCKATKRQQTTKPPVNRETTGRRQLHQEYFPKWNPSDPPKAPEELTWAERIVSKPDPRDEEMIHLREEVRSLRQAITQPHPSPVTQTITRPSHPPTGHPLPLDTQSSSPAETSTSIPPTKKKRKDVPPPSAKTTELEQSDKTVEMEAQFEAKLEAKLTAKLAHFQQQMRDEFQQFLDKRLQTHSRLDSQFSKLGSTASLTNASNF